MTLTKRQRRQLAIVIREAADTSGIDPYTAAVRIIQRWPTLELEPSQMTADIARALATMGIPTPKLTDTRGYEQLLNAVRYVRKPYLPKRQLTILPPNAQPGQGFRIQAGDQGAVVAASPGQKVKSGGVSLGPFEAVDFVNDGKDWYVVSRTTSYPR